MLCLALNAAMGQFRTFRIAGPGGQISALRLPANCQYLKGGMLNAPRAGEIRADIEIVPLRIFVIGALNWTIEWFNHENREAVLNLARRTELLIFDGPKKS